MRTGNTRKEERVVREHNKIEEHEHNTIGTHRVASYSCPAAHHREDGEKHAEARHSREERGQAVVVFLSNPSPKKNVGSLNNQGEYHANRQRRREVGLAQVERFGTNNESRRERHSNERLQSVSCNKSVSVCHVIRTRHKW